MAVIIQITTDENPGVYFAISRNAAISDPIDMEIIILPIITRVTDHMQFFMSALAPASVSGSA